MLVLASILDNPGEPPAETRYRDLAELRRLGYTDLVTYQTTGLSGLLGPDSIGSPDVRRWVGEQYERNAQLAQSARQAGLGFWLAYDAPSLALDLVGTATTCVRQPRMLCPASDELLDLSGQCLESLLGRLEWVDGVVLRLGDNDAHRLPYMVGNDIYAPHCARCNTMGRADRLVRFIQYFYDLIVRRGGRKLIVRAWNIRPGGLHDSPELCRRVVEQLPEDERLILSFKFTQTDFWRYQSWNASSRVCGDRPIIYELQCQREFEAKGAVPNYQPPLWRDGMAELADPVGLATVSREVNLAGLWAWVRGGGWGGPFVSDETWIDANVVAVPQLASNPQADTRQLARDWITDRLDCRDSAAAAALLSVLEHSPSNVAAMFYVGAYARAKRDPWFPSSHFIQDDLIDAAAGAMIIDGLPESVLDDVIAEKHRAVEQISRDRRAIQQAGSNLVQPPGEMLANSMQYMETLAETLEYMLTALVHYRRYRRRKDPSLARATIEAVSHCQGYWNHHQRYANFRGTATAFRSDNLWDFTQELLDRVR